MRGGPRKPPGSHLKEKMDHKNNDTDNNNKNSHSNSDTDQNSAGLHFAFGIDCLRGWRLAPSPFSRPLKILLSSVLLGMLGRIPIWL